jgi:hypothetical protein
LRAEVLRSEKRTPIKSRGVVLRVRLERRMVMGERRIRVKERRRCLVEGCGRQVRPGKVVCAGHGRTAAGKQAQRAVHRLAGDLTELVMQAETEEQAAVAGKFRQRVERGEYGELLDEGLQEVIWQAGAQRTLREEVGALRVAAKRLLLEEEDAAKMALGLSRVTAALGRLLYLGREIDREWGTLERWDQKEQAALKERLEAALARAEAAERGTRSEERGARDGEREGKGQGRYTIAKAVAEWRERGGGGSDVWSGDDVGEDVVDRFLELRPGG